MDHGLKWLLGMNCCLLNYLEIFIELYKLEDVHSFGTTLKVVELDILEGLRWSGSGVFVVIFANSQTNCFVEELSVGKQACFVVN